MVSRGQFQATVAANVAVCREHYRLVLRVPDFPATEPGQFVQISCTDDAHKANKIETDWQIGTGADWLDPRAMLRRPFSLAGRSNLADCVELVIIHRVVGIGTAWLAKLREG